MINYKITRRENYITGHMFGNIEYLEEAGYRTDPKYGKKRREAIFKCYCGKKFKSSISVIKRGITKSCGCYNKQRIQETNIIHGLNKHPLYGQWQNMKNRCYCKNNIGYNFYGEKGIIVCEEWRTEFISFYNWAQCNNWKLGLQIDRIDNDGNYEPKNCRIANYAQQARNRKTNIIVSLDDQSMCLKDYCAKLNVDYPMVRHRFKDLNWSLEKSISTKRRTDIINELNG